MAVRLQDGSTYALDGVYVAGTGSVVGPKEGEGPLGGDFDRVWSDEIHDSTSFEKAEQALLSEALETSLDKAGLEWNDVELVLGGDLLDQTVTTNFVGRTHQRPLAGLFAACATFTEALGLGALLVAGSGFKWIAASASSHHSTAERQFRFPLELGYQRPPTAAWTSTAAGAAIVGSRPSPIRIEAVTLGRVVDYGSTDANNMASAMAPAAFDTIWRHLRALGADTASYDAIYTGDLGHFGVALLQEYARERGLELTPQLEDCGRALYDRDRQDTHNGGSGPGCSASVFAGPLMRRLGDGRMHRLLLVATGALFSPTTYQQGESIPCIAHAVQFCREEGA